MDEPVGQYAKWNKPDKKKTNIICGIEKDQIHKSKG
jgi:hypothetical protein